MMSLKIIFFYKEVSKKDELFKSPLERTTFYKLPLSLFYRYSNSSLCSSSSSLIEGNAISHFNVLKDV